MPVACKIFAERCAMLGPCSGGSGLKARSSSHSADTTKVPAPGSPAADKSGTSVLLTVLLPRHAVSNSLMSNDAAMPMRSSLELKSQSKTLICNCCLQQCTGKSTARPEPSLPQVGLRHFRTVGDVQVLQPSVATTYGSEVRGPNIVMSDAIRSRPACKVKRKMPTGSGYVRSVMSTASSSFRSTAMRRGSTQTPAIASATAALTVPRRPGMSATRAAPKK
mmetsp:Transcript_62928/g.124400  ORF Transcript_62928/g.124400 Transcript_62928/m.124400 type:complete len:221 (-) Transcript_62928:460-1122(-)